MEPNGDPEARIRDLERPLADRAAESEMGTRPYENAAPPPPPPYGYGTPTAAPTGADPYQGGSYDQYGTTQYGSPYYAEPQRVVHKRSASTALWLIPLVVVAFAAAGVVGAVLYFSVGIPSPGKPIAGGGGPLDAPQSQSQSSIPTPEIETSIDSTEQIITVDAGGVVSLGGVETTQTIVCNQGAVNISGVSNTVEIQGTCASVNVSGVENIVTVESAATIEVSGFQNRVTYRDGEPAISRSGSDNVVEQG